MADKKKAEVTNGDTKSPEERTKTVMVPRVNNVLEALRILGNCANPTTYKVTAGANKKIFDEIHAEVKRIEKLFADAAEGKTTKEIKQGFAL